MAVTLGISSLRARPGRGVRSGAPQSGSVAKEGAEQERPPTSTPHGSAAGRQMHLAKWKRLSLNAVQLCHQLHEGLSVSEDFPAPAEPYAREPLRVGQQLEQGRLSHVSRRDVLGQATRVPAV